jgi:anti-sigma B factor antagonist
MEIAEETRSGVLALAPRGRVDSGSSAALHKALLGPLEQGVTRLVVDMAGIEYISSAGLRVFLLLARGARERGAQLTLCGMRPAVRQVFDLAGFTPQFRVEPDLEAAVTAPVGA